MRHIYGFGVIASFIAAGLLSAPSLFGGKAASVTFNKDVAPIIFENCMVCHRAGEIGPMPLTSYKEARPWAKSIREAVLAREMPPWAPTRVTASFRRPLTFAKEIDTLVAWADGGAKEGDPKDLAARAKIHRRLGYRQT